MGCQLPQHPQPDPVAPADRLTMAGGPARPQPSPRADNRPTAPATSTRAGTPPTAATTIAPDSSPLSGPRPQPIGGSRLMGALRNVVASSSPSGDLAPGETAEPPHRVSAVRSDPYRHASSVPQPCASRPVRAGRCPGRALTSASRAIRRSCAPGGPRRRVRPIRQTKLSSSDAPAGASMKSSTGSRPSGKR